eukprot:6854535-Pyramimonas_sp.AAC.1
MAAMLVAMLTATTGQSMTAPMLIAPPTMTASSRRRSRLWKEFDMRARQTRESGPRGRTVPPRRAHKGARTIS